MAVEHPNGVTLGPPGDAARQAAVLRGTLKALFDISEPGGLIHLPFTWPDYAEDLETEPEQAPPIVGAIVRRPWLFRRLLNREFPDIDD